MTTAAQALLAEDAFVGACLGGRVYRLTDIARAADALGRLPGTHSPVMVEAKVPTADTASVARLTAVGFRVIDTNIQLDVRTRDLQLDTSSGSGAWRVRDAVPADREGVERVSGENLTTSRFHLDPQIAAEAACRVKRAWAGNFFEGRRGQRLLVIETEHGIGGFLLAIEKAGDGVIDLVALDPAMRGTGALEGLIGGWIERAPALTRLVVGTQVSNVRSLRAYGRIGFRVCAAAYVLHYHG